MRIKIGILFALIFLFFFAGAVWFIYASVKGILVENENQRLTARALLIAEKTDIAPIVLPLPEAHERFAVWYDNGSTLQELFRSPGLEIEKFSTSATIQEGDKHRIAWITNDRNEIGGKIIVAIEFTESSLNSNVQRLLILLIITLIVSIFISFGMAYYASGVLLQPIRDIITTAKTINSANLTHPITVAATNDELEELGKTINDMLLRIENGLQMQNNFFASASHELRTPLSVLQAQFEVEILNPEVNEYSKSILRSQLQEVKRLNRLVEDFLTLSQIRANMVQLRKEAVELDDLVISIVERCRVLMEQSRVYLKLDLQEYESFRVHADRDKLIHVIINLTENAIKYSVPHSTIHVHLEKASSEIVRITIANQTQRPLTNLEELKQEFYRADVFQQGYGLGLWISNKILEAHNYRLLLSQHENTFVSTIECKTITENN